MIPNIFQSDVTGTVNLTSPTCTADAVCAILAKRYPDFNELVVRQAFKDIEDAFWGRYPGLLACDTPYHDLRHSLSTALLMARLVDGYEAAHGPNVRALSCEEGTLAVVLALFHDIGFLRLETEASMNGACLIHDHEQRGVDFMRTYLAKGYFANLADQADLIHATNFDQSIDETLKGLPRELFVIGQLLGTADLVSQIGGRYYLERCHHFLYLEFVSAGADRYITPDGDTVVLYASPDELLRKTPDFYERVVKPRLEQDFDKVYRYVAHHFGGDDPYARGMQRNMTFLRRMIEKGDFSSLRRKPLPLMPSPAI